MDQHDEKRIENEEDACQHEIEEVELFKRNSKAAETAAYRKHCVQLRKMKERKECLWKNLEAAILGREKAKRMCTMLKISILKSYFFYKLSSCLQSDV